MPDRDLCEIPDIHRRQSHRLEGDVGRLPETSGARATNDRLNRVPLGVTYPPHPQAEDGESAHPRVGLASMARVVTDAVLAWVSSTRVGQTRVASKLSGAAAPRAFTHPT